jgi:hypothetical protein
MPRLDERNLALGAIESAEHAVDAIARITEKMAHAPSVAR